ncbi:hypothetical protein [Parvularcula lutaonensis]|uniref:Uncharacterized protein n=1 Tax=Parvularcula lutaonensis TaxID=491923 RepID=A0ABV7MA08_9PROT|nr:hypothetical protein [Parvularcula lutaonensis]GGY43870.1 hypothetical protein GCM10007148_10860 [Parvularcula lutaonensis]
MDHGVSILKLTSAMARHAAHAHAVTADNIARADIPGARAKAAADFQASLRGAGSPEFRARDEGGLVSIEREMLAMGEARGRHDAALAVWKSTLSMMRIAIGGPQG